MPGKSRWTIGIAVVAAALAGAWWAGWREPPNVEEAVAVPRAPRISPDYGGIVVPPNIAPLNFSIRERGCRFLVRIRSEAGDAIEIVSDSPRITIPPHRWRQLLEANRGKGLWFEVCTEVEKQWQRYQTIVNHIAEDDIDGWLVFRVIGPTYTYYRETAIHQRDLATFEESTVIDGLSLRDTCVNCHTFTPNDPGRMLIGFRSATFGVGTLHVDGGEVEKLGVRFGYTAWHPSGRAAVYTNTIVRQFYHAAGDGSRDGVDLDGDLEYYRFDTRKARLVPCAGGEQRLKTFPTWSPDGRFLYYCSAPCLWPADTSIPPQRYAEVKYDLMRISYDVDADQWGKPETVLAAEKTGLSVVMPRISPDGKFLLFCMCLYGCFPAFQSSSDLYMMDLATGTYSKAEASSEFSESWHSWSSNSRWIAFSSKRGGGPFTRCYLSFVDPMGRTHKPFILPQGDPEFYDSSLKMFGLPELVPAPVPVSRAALERAVRSGKAAPAKGSVGVIE